MKPVIRFRAGCPTEQELAAIILALEEWMAPKPPDQPVSAWALQARLSQPLPSWGPKPSAWPASCKTGYP